MVVRIVVTVHRANSKKLTYLLVFKMRFVWRPGQGLGCRSGQYGGEPADSFPTISDLINAYIHSWCFER